MIFVGNGRDHPAVAGSPASPPGSALGHPAVTELRAWSAAEKEWVRTAVAGAAAQWGEAWGIAVCDALGTAPRAAVKGTVLVTPFDAPESGIVGHAWREAWPGVWWALSSPVPPRRGAGVDAGGVGALSAALFCEPVTPWSSPRSPEPESTGASGTIAEDVARGAWADWWARLGDAARCEGEPLLDAAVRSPPPAAWARWSGALLLTLPWLEGTLRLLLSGDRVQAMVRPEPRAGRPGVELPHLTPVWRAAGGRRVPLRVNLHSFELELGALAGLRVGDVLQTAHRLDVPLTVAMDGAAGDRDDAAVCAAFLGRAGARQAADLRRVGPKNDP